MKMVLIAGWVSLMSGMFFAAHHKEGTVILPVYNDRDVQLKSSKGVWLNNGSPFTGTLLSQTPAGDTLSISSFVNGREHGEWKTFYSRSKPRAIRYYSHGKKTGELMAWHENGQLSVKASFVDGEYDGLLQEWDAEGHLLKESTYDKGYEAGRQRAWYPNGKVRSNYTVIEGKRYGLLGTKNCINVSDSIIRSL